MSLFFQNLGSNVVGSAADGLLGVPLVLDLGRQSEVAYFGVHLVVDEDVPEVEVPVNDALLVNVDHGFDDLSDVDPGLKLSQSFPAFGQILQSVVPAVLQQNVDVFFILEGIDELHDMLVL